MKLQKKILLLVILIIVFSVLLMGFITQNLISYNMSSMLGQQALELASFLSTLDKVKGAYIYETPSQVLQPLAESLHSGKLASFVVFMDNDGNRLSHPSDDLIGLEFTGGDHLDALNGQSYISSAVGISGPSIRGFAPIYLNNQQVGAVSVGMFQDNIDILLAEYTDSIIYTTLVTIIVAIPAALILSHNIKHTIFGLEPADIATLLNQRDIMINSVKEGIIFSDQNDNLALVNERAKYLLGLSENDIGNHIRDVIPTSRMEIVRQTGIDEENETQKINGVTIITNRKIVKYNGEIMGVVATFTEREELQKLAEELTNSKIYANGLRAKTHEFMNQLQTIAGLIELEEYEEAKKYISISSVKNQDTLKYLTDRIKDPVTVGFLLGKKSETQEMGMNLILSDDTKLHHLDFYTDGDTMVLLLGNLINNSIEAINNSNDKSKGYIYVTIMETLDALLIKVEDNGPGLTMDIDELTKKGVSTKHGNRGFGLHLVKSEVTNILGGTFDIFNNDGVGVTAIIRIPTKG